MAMMFRGWESRGDSGGGGMGGLFLKLEVGHKYKVRLISRPIGYLQHWEPIICRSPGNDKNGTPLDPLMIRGFKPKERFAIWVFDRNDDNKLKVMDFPPSLFDQFVEWKDAYNEEPGGKNGPDWSIRIESKTGQKRNARYKALALDRSPLTEEELERIKAGFNGVPLKDKLVELRKDHSPEEILAMLAESEGKGDGDGGGEEAEQANEKTETKTSAPKASAAPSASEEDDDLNF